MGGDARLPKRIMFGNLEGVVRRGRDGKGKLWTDCVQSAVRAFEIEGNWKVTVLEAMCGLGRPRRVGGGLWPSGGNTR